MPTYMLRMSADYWMCIDAVDAEEAENIGHHTDVNEWDDTWSAIEVEPVDTTPEEEPTHAE